MKIAVAGKGGSGKTTVAATVARQLARAGHSVLALDADTNPMLGISLGIGPEETYRLLAVRRALDEGRAEHEESAEGLIERFGTDAPDGVRLVVALREDRIDPGCVCCGGITPQQLLAQLDGERWTVVCDLEAGVGAVVHGGKADLVMVVVEPSAKSIEVARRAAATASAGARVVVVANRLRGEEDLEPIRDALGDHEIFEVPEDPAITRADEVGKAPVDAAPDSPAVTAIGELSRCLTEQPAAA